jgi:hypothetical protein
MLDQKTKDKILPTIEELTPKAQVESTKDTIL